VGRSINFSGHQRNQTVDDSWRRMLKEHQRIIPPSWSDLFEVWCKPWLTIGRCAKECPFLHNHRKINKKFACSFCFWKGTAERMRSYLTELSCSVLSLLYGLLVQCSEFPYPVSQLLSQRYVLLCKVLDWCI